MDPSKSKRTSKRTAPGSSNQSRRELQEAKEYAENIVSTVREPLVVLDADLRIISANQSFYRVFSVRQEETEGKLIYAVGNGQWNIPKLSQLLENILPQNTSFENYEVDHEFPSLGRRIMLLNAHRFHDGGARTQKILLAIEDVTERKRIEHELASSELRYRRLFETAQDGILILNPQTGEITDVNPFLVDMLGYSKEELLGKRLWEIGFFKDDTASRQAFRVLQDKGYIRYEDLPLETKNGKSMDVEFVSNVYAIDGEEVIQCNVRDITERKKAEEQLHRQQKLAQTYLNVVGMMLVAIDASGKVTLINRKGCEILGYEAHEIIGKDWFDHFLPERLRKEIRDISRRILGGEIERFAIYENPILTKSGQERIIAWHTVTLTDDASNIVSHLSSGEDVTERKQAEVALKSTLEKIQAQSMEISALLDGARAVLIYREFKDASRAIFDYCKNLIGATGGYVALLNKEGTANEVLFLEAGGRPCDVDPALPMPIRGLRNEAYKMGKGVYDNDFDRSKWATLMPEGHVTLDNVLFAPLMFDGKALGLIGLANKEGGFTENDARIASAFADLAAIALQNSRALELLESSEQTLRQSEERLKQAQAMGKIGNWEFDLATQKIEWSDEVYKIYERDKSLGPPTVEEEENYYPAEETARLRELANRTIENGEESQCDFIAQPTGVKRVFLHTSMFPLKDASGRVIKLFGTVQDITARKQTEEQIKQSNIELEAINRELDAFSYTLPHDLKAPLRNMDGFSRALLEDYPDKLDDTGKEYLRHIHESSKQMSSMIDGMLEFSRVTRGEIQKDTVNLSNIAESVAAELQKTDPGRLAMFVITPGIQADGDVRLLRIVLENLLGNAWKFTAKTKKPVIEFSVTGHEGETVYFVRDNGAGFDMKYVEKLFNPFQRLHSTSEYAGTGIGLASVQRIVSRHGGRVWAEGEAGKGATFYFTLD